MVQFRLNTRLVTNKFLNMYRNITSRIKIRFTSALQSTPYEVVFGRSPPATFQDVSDTFNLTVKELIGYFDSADDPTETGEKIRSDAKPTEQGTTEVNQI